MMIITIQKIPLPWGTKPHIRGGSVPHGRGIFWYYCCFWLFFHPYQNEKNRQDAVADEDKTN